MLLFNHHYFSFPENSLLKPSSKCQIWYSFSSLSITDLVWFFLRAGAWLVKISTTYTAFVRGQNCKPVIFQKVETLLFLHVSNILMTNLPCTFRSEEQ